MSSSNYELDNVREKVVVGDMKLQASLPPGSVQSRSRPDVHERRGRELESKLKKKGELRNGRLCDFVLGNVRTLHLRGMYLRS